MSFKIKNSQNEKPKISADTLSAMSSSTMASQQHVLDCGSCETSSSLPQTDAEHGFNSGILSTTRRTFTRQRKKNPTPGALFRRMERELVRNGYLNISMLFGYVCAMREANGLKPYASKCSMITALERYNLPFKLVKYAGNTVRRWYHRTTTAAALCEIRQRDHDAFLSTPASDAELVSGEWLDIVATERLTGIKRKRISSIGGHHIEITRLHPKTNTRLFHVPSVRDYGYWRDSAYIRKMYGDNAADALLHFRPQKKYITGGCRKTLVYCPDLAHL